MRLLRTYLLLPFLALPAMAQVSGTQVFLQFGSFESRDEAEDKLNDVSTAHTGLIGGLPLAIREVAIAEGLTVYRTQAGPVGSRTKAQSMCAQLASNGDACYIVETAIQQAAPAPRRAAPTPPPVQKALEEQLEEAVTELRNGLKPIPEGMEEAREEVVAQQQAVQETVPAPRRAPRLPTGRDARNLEILQQASGASAPRRPRMPAPQIASQGDVVANAVSPEMEAALQEAASSAPR